MSGRLGGALRAGDADTTRDQRIVIECKIQHQGRDATIREGLPQTVAYMDTWAAEEGHLVITKRLAPSPPIPDPCP